MPKIFEMSVHDFFHFSLRLLRSFFRPFSLCLQSAVLHVSFFSGGALWSHANIHQICSFEFRKPIFDVHVKGDSYFSERWDDDRTVFSFYFSKQQRIYRSLHFWIFPLRGFQLNNSISFNGLHRHSLIAYFQWNADSVRIFELKFSSKCYYNRCRYLHTPKITF